MKLREVRFVNSVVNGGTDEVLRLQSFDPRNGRDYAGDLRLEDGYVRWLTRFAPLSNVRVLVEDTGPEPVAVPAKAVAGGKKR